MATKRTVPGQKASGHELSSALTTYKEINSALAMPCPPIHEFRSMNDALSAYISLSKILAAKVQEMLEVPLHVELQEKIDKLKSQLIDENLKCEKLLTENEFLNTQIPVLMEKLETFRVKALEMNQNSAGIVQNERVEELQQEILKNKEKVRMNSQLTQALSESVKREQQLKEQCENLMQSLNESLKESQNLSKKLQVFENSTNFTKKNSELLKIIENDLERGGEKWKQLKYSRIEGLSDKENFELLRKIVDFRDLNLGTKEMKIAELGPGESFTLKEALQEREADIKDLLRDYEKLQCSCKELERNLQNREDELIALREKLAEKTSQLVNAYETSDLRQEDSQDLIIIRENYLQMLSQNQALVSQLSVINNSAKDFFLVLKDLDAEGIDKNTFLVRAEEAFKWRLALEVQSLESNLVDSLKETLQVANQLNLQVKLSEKALEIQVNGLKAINEELKKTDNAAKNHKNDWKKFRREHLQRIEKIYESQLTSLKEQILSFSRNNPTKDEKLGKITEKLQTELKELTIALKKEHEGKKKLADLFTKEKESCEKTRDSLEKLKEDHDHLQKRYQDSKSALEDSNKKIFRLEHSLSKTTDLEISIIEKEKNLKSQVEDLEIQKTKLYSEITRLNKKIQEFEQEKQKLDYESKSNFYFTQENRESLFNEIQNREEKISGLEKENFQLKNEIFELDVRLKSCEMDVEKMANMKKTINELQKQLLAVEMIGREKSYLNEENANLREDLKNSQGTVQQLKVELRNISTELVEIQSELAKSQNFANTSAKQLQESHSTLKIQNESLQRERETLSKEMNQMIEEVSSYRKAKKALEIENSSLRAKIQNVHKDMPAEFEAVKEKVQELEMRYESLEAAQDEMIVALRKSYKNWCNSKKINPGRINCSDIAKEAVFIVDHLIHESKRPADFETSKEIIEKTQYLLGKIENQPDSTFKAHTLRLISENIELKQEMIEKHQKAVEDENIFQELKSIPGVNEWTLQKWKDSERDVTRLRKQLLEMTVELEKMIQSYQKTGKNDEVEYLHSETEFLKHRVIELEEQVLKLNNEKIENKQEFIKADKEKEMIRSSFNEIYHSVTGKFPENESISMNTQVILECLDHLHSSSQVQDRVLSDYESLRHREKLLDQRLHDMSTQENSGLVSALYEEKKLREELEEELTEKCNLIERVLQEFEENKKNLKVREYEYQELLTLKDEEILKLKRELTGRNNRYS